MPKYTELQVNKLQRRIFTNCPEKAEGHYSWNTWLCSETTLSSLASCLSPARRPDAFDVPGDGPRPGWERQSWKSAVMRLWCAFLYYEDLHLYSNSPLGPCWHLSWRTIGLKQCTWIHHLLNAPWHVPHFPGHRMKCLDPSSQPRVTLNLEFICLHINVITKQFQRITSHADVYFNALRDNPISPPTHTNM